MYNLLKSYVAMFFGCKKLGASRDEVKSAILVGLPAVGLTIIDPLEAALKVFDGKSDQIL